MLRRLFWQKLTDVSEVLSTAIITQKTVLFMLVAFKTPNINR
jgi:hypothetical protein